MEKKNKGLADAQEGDFILNESGTAISTDAVEGVDIPAKPDTPDAKNTAAAQRAGTQDKQNE